MKSLFKPFSFITLYLLVSSVSLGAYAYAEYYGRDIMGKDDTKKEHSSGYHSTGSRIHHK